MVDKGSGCFEGHFLIDCGEDIWSFSFLEKGFRKAISLSCLGTSTHALGPVNFIECWPWSVVGHGRA